MNAEDLEAVNRVARDSRACFGKHGVWMPVMVDLFSHGTFGAGLNAFEQQSQLHPAQLGNSGHHHF